MQNFKPLEVMLSPLGTIKGIDGRVFVVDSSVFDTLKASKLDIPINVDHSGSAVGWIKNSSLKLDDNAIYGLLELNDTHKDLVVKKQYRYLSPAYLVDQDNHVQTITSLSLVNTPNILNQALNSIQGAPMQIEKDTEKGQEVEGKASQEVEGKDLRNLDEALKPLYNALANLSIQVEELKKLLEAKEEDKADEELETETNKAQNQAKRTKQIKSLVANNAILPKRVGALMDFKGDDAAFDEAIEIYKLEACAIYNKIELNKVQATPHNTLEELIERQLGQFGHVSPTTSN
ncbi:phage protease [Helicobacter suis]|uniref:phage protease n=1 Tax=Helicobacter suis TaxID=104628 RepID=UPI0013D127DA|nr:phage protease [Helicobacter suis]